LIFCGSGAFIWGHLEGGIYEAESSSHISTIDQPCK